MSAPIRVSVRAAAMPPGSAPYHRQCPTTGRAERGCAPGRSVHGGCVSPSSSVPGSGARREPARTPSSPRPGPCQEVAIAHQPPRGTRQTPLEQEAAAQGRRSRRTFLAMFAMEVVSSQTCGMASAGLGSRAKALIFGGQACVAHPPPPHIRPLALARVSLAAPLTPHPLYAQRTIFSSPARARRARRRRCRRSFFCFFFFLPCASR